MKKSLLVLAMATALLAVSGCGSTGASPTASGDVSAKTPEAVTYQSLQTTDGITSAEICNSYSAVLSQSLAQGKARAKKARGKDGGPYVAASFAKYNAWVEVSQFDNFEAAMDKAALAALNTVTNGRAGEVSDRTLYQKDSIASCGLEADVVAVADVLSSLDALANRIVSQAENLPWYPKGYTEYDSDLAYKWTTHKRSADCSDCIYWTMQVIANTGCLGGVYAELNIMRNGEVVDWTNDSVPSLAAGQVAFLEFISYQDGSGSSYQGQLTSLNCHV